MERRERRRKASSKASTVVETKTEAGRKPAKLVLKASSALSPRVEKKPRVSTILDNCLASETPEEVLEQLLSFTDADINGLSLLAERSLGVLRELWRRWREKGDVCGVIVRVFVELVTSGSGEWEEVRGGVREFVLQLPDHENYNVKVLGLAAIRKLAQCDATLTESALVLAQKEIHHVHHAVRVECLNLIGQLSHVTSDSDTPLVTLEEYCSDPDPRVRAVSLHSLLLKLKGGTSLKKTVYKKACDALVDDDEAVRTVAVRLVCSLVEQTPEDMVPVPQKASYEVQMCDDAFTRVCDLLNDVSMPVRALAAEMLGRFHSVSPKLLDQTLDKKLMSHLKGVKSDHERQKEQHAAGGGGGSSGFDSGRTWGSGIPKLDLDLEERSLMSAGACGAFIHGLEDEYLEVRAAAVSSMCQLGIRCSSFGEQCIDFLVDMFNDEIQSVRLSAINSLRQVSATIQLREDQMETVLGVLEESSAEIREAMHALLSTCQITTIPALRTTVNSLLDNLKKYPFDRESICRCLQQLGSHHSHLVSCLVPELLNSHPFLMGKEPDVDDPAYVCILILVFNAAALCPTIPPLLHSHVFRHYTYLRDALPQFIPHISVGMPSNSVQVLGLPKKHTGHTIAHSFLQQVLCRAQATLPPSSSSSASHRCEVLGTCISDLLGVGGLDGQLSDRALCAASFLQCQLLSEEVSQALSQDLLLLPSDGRLGPTHTQGAINELMTLSYRLHTLCQGLGVELVGGVRIARVTAHAMQLLLAVQLDMDTELSKEFMSMKQKFHERLTSLTRYFTDSGLDLPVVVKSLVDVDFATIATDSLTQCLQPLVTTSLFASLAPRDLVSVRMARAVIHKPQPFTQDDHMRFVYNLALAIPVQAVLYNITREADIAIQLKFPDGRRLLFSPKSSDFRCVGAHETRLDTLVVTSHGLWTDPGQVELCVCVRLTTDVPEDTPLAQITHKNTTHSTFPHSNRVHSHSEDGIEPGHCILAISDVIKINIFPQETATRSFNVFGGH